MTARPRRWFESRGRVDGVFFQHGSLHAQSIAKAGRIAVQNGLDLSEGNADELQGYDLLLNGKLDATGAAFWQIERD
jgi:hypothetical protein